MEVLFQGSHFQRWPVKMRGLPRWRSASMEVSLHGGLFRERSVTMEGCLRGIYLEGRVPQRIVSTDLCRGRT